MRALAILKTHDAAIDDTSLGVLGGVLIRLTYFARDRATWMWPAAACCIYTVLIGLVHGFLNKTYDNLKDSTFLSIVFYAAIVVPVFLFTNSVLEKRHRKSEAYLTALQSFHDGAHSLLDELDGILQPHGYHLVVAYETGGTESSLNPSLLNPPGTMVVKVQLGGGDANSTTQEGTPPSLPPVSDEFLGRVTPLTEVQADVAMGCLLAKGVPVDEWTLGALMTRLRCAQKELRQDGKIVYISHCFFTSASVIGIGITFALCYWLNLDWSVMLIIWWIPVLVILLPALVLFLYVQERIEGETKHELFRSATEKASSLALRRHGVEMVYSVEPTFFRGVTKGVIKFVEATPVISEKEEAAGSILEPVHIV